jgi:hypothetical protein
MVLETSHSTLHQERQLTLLPVIYNQMAALLLGLMITTELQKDPGQARTLPNGNIDTWLAQAVVLLC